MKDAIKKNKEGEDEIKSKKKWTKKMVVTTKKAI